MKIQIARWLNKPARRIVVVVLFLLLLVAIGLSVQLSVKLHDDEQQTCKIQAVGLPASHELANVIGDIHALLILPPSPQARKQPPPSARVQQLIADLNRNAAAYAKREAKQPMSRSC